MLFLIVVLAVMFRLLILLHELVLPLHLVHYLTPLGKYPVGFVDFTEQ